MRRVFGLLACLLAGPGAAQELTLPAGAQQLAERVRSLDSYALPVGPHGPDGIATLKLEGRVERLSWRIRGGSRTPLQVLAPLRAQIAEAGYDILLDCDARACGGFDFRFATEVIPAPDMYVANRDYRFLSAVAGEAGLSLLVSRVSGLIYVQMIRVTPPGEDAPATVAPDVSPVAPPVRTGEDLADALQRNGRAILADLDFATGSDVLGAGPYGSLRALATLMAEQPEMRIVLVGHTDAVGRLADNIALGKRRADAVRRRLADELGLDEARIETAGAGYLAPLTTNATPEGREANRRVEAVLLLP